jgi:Domain of unknown function (DUF2017)
MTTTGFRRASGGGARIKVAAEEAAVVRTLVGQLLEILGEDDRPDRPQGADDGMPSFTFSENTEPSSDPVLARLFPNAYSDDDDSAAEFRRYTEAGLRDGKREAAQIVLDTLGDGGDVRLDADQCQAWLRALNDIRLALGTRLEIDEDFEHRLKGLDWDDPRYAAFAAYDWLTYLQESLVGALS